MEKATRYIKNTAIVVLSGLVLFEAVVAILAVVGATTWESFNDLTIKALIVAVIVLVANAVVVVLTNAATPSNTGKK